MHLINDCIKFIEKTTRTLNALSTVIIFMMMILMTMGIITRLLGRPFTGITNISESFLVIAVYLSIAYTQQTKQHVSVELFILSLNERNKRFFSVISIIVSLIICSIIFFTSWDYALDSWKIREKMDGAPFYPIYPPKIAIAVGVSFLWLQLLADLLRKGVAFFIKSEDGNA